MVLKVMIHVSHINISIFRLIISSCLVAICLSVLAENNDSLASPFSVKINFSLPLSALNIPNGTIHLISANNQETNDYELAVIFSGFAGCTQLIGWIATLIFLWETYVLGEQGCLCSGIVAYVFTFGLSGIPHLMIVMYIKLKTKLPENQPLL